MRQRVIQSSDSLSDDNQSKEAAFSPARNWSRLNCHFLCYSISSCLGWFLLDWMSLDNTLPRVCVCVCIWGVSLLYNDLSIFVFFFFDELEELVARCAIHSCIFRIIIKFRDGSGVVIAVAKRINSVKTLRHSLVKTIIRSSNNNKYM